MRFLVVRRSEGSPAWVTWPLVAALLALVTASLSATILDDPDTLWHIAVGRWIVTHRQLPMQDMFSWTMPGVPWTAHEWLSELVFFEAWSVAGFPGIIALVSLSFALTAALVTRFFCARLEPLHVVPVSLVFIAVISTHLLARPHALVWPLMAAWTALLVVAVEARRTPPWWSLGILLAWVNLHASFTLGLIMASALALEAITEAPDREARLRALRQWSGFGAGCLVAVSINPNGLGTLGHAVHMMQMKEMLSLINEWQSANFHEFQLVLLWIILVLGLGLIGRLRMAPVRGALVLLLFYMALKHGRYHSTLALASAFLLATPIGDGLRSLRPASNGHAGPSRLDGLMERLSGPSRHGAVAGALLLAIGWVIGARGLMRSAPPESIAPAKAVAALGTEGRRDHLLNGYGFGGYLILRGIPVFIDGRADMYGDPFLRAMADAFTMKTPHAFERYLDAHAVNWTLLAARAPAVELLDHLPSWRRVYGDTIAVVHARREPLATPSRAGVSRR